MTKILLLLSLVSSNASMASVETLKNGAAFTFVDSKSKEMIELDSTEMDSNLNFIKKEEKGIVLPEYTDTKIFNTTATLLIMDGEVTPPILFYSAFDYFNQTVKTNLSMGYKMQFYKGDSLLFGSGVGNNGNLIANLQLTSGAIMDYLNYLEKVANDKEIAPDDKIGFTISIAYVNFLAGYKSSFNYLKMDGSQSKIVDSNNFQNSGSTLVTFVLTLKTTIRFY